MTKADREILASFATALRQRFPKARIWAFGSRTRDTFMEDSDFDACIVLPVLDDHTDRAVLDIAWKVGFENDRLISTVTYSEEEFERGPCSKSPLVATILDEGVGA